MVFEFLIPILQISLFCTCTGREPYNLPIAVVNNETMLNSTYNGSMIFLKELNNRTLNMVCCDFKTGVFLILNTRYHLNYRKI